MSWKNQRPMKPSGTEEEKRQIQADGRNLLWTLVCIVALTLLIVFVMSLIGQPDPKTEEDRKWTQEILDQMDK